MDTVWIKHPKLPGSPPVQVPASALPEHQRSGWQETNAPPEPDPGPDTPASEQPTTDGAPADARASSLSGQSPRGRRASSKETE